MNLPGGAVTVEGEQNILVVDFVVDQSFGVGAGMSDSWVMTPVLNATEFGLTGGIAASAIIADAVTMPNPDGDGTPVTLADFEISVQPAAGGDESSADLGDPDGDGAYEAAVLFLNPDDSPFEVELEAPDGVTITTEGENPAEVDASSGQQASVSFTITSAEATSGT